MSGGQRRFPTTCWSSIADAAEAAASGELELVGDLLQRYRGAIVTHLRQGWRLSEADAEDLAQSFLMDKMILGQLLSKADEQRGRFRNYLARSLDNYVRQWLRKGGHEGQAGPGQTVASATEDQLPPAAQAPHGFTVAWGRRVLDLALRQAWAHCEQHGQQAMWAVVEARLLRPILEGAEPVSYEELARRHGYASAKHAANALTSGKRILSRCLREVIQAYCASSAEVDQEIRDLRAAFSESHA